MNALIPAEDGSPLPGVRRFLGQLLEANVVDALYVPLETGVGTAAPALVADPARLEGANPFVPLMPINGARAISTFTGRSGGKFRLGAVLRPCELRALVELVKLQQASLEGVTLIGLDCPGTFEAAEFVRYSAGGNGNIGSGDRQAGVLKTYLEAARDGVNPVLDGLELRTACQMCTQPVPEGVDIHLHLFGVDAKQGLPVTLREEVMAALGQVQPQGRDQGSFTGGFRRLEAETVESVGTNSAASKLISSRQQVRDRELTGIRASMDSGKSSLAGSESRSPSLGETASGLVDLFAGCIRCHNCMTVCPICYCKTCLFRTAAFDHEPEHYLSAARRKGAARLPGDTLLFHLIRMNHMSTSCVSCGMCTSACPAGIPVGLIFSAVGAQVQAAFDYLPGRSLTEPLPLVTFQANEWTDVGE